MCLVAEKPKCKKQNNIVTSSIRTLKNDPHQEKKNRFKKYTLILQFWRSDVQAGPLWANDQSVGGARPSWEPRGESGSCFSLGPSCIFEAGNMDPVMTCL